jgi:hypothetical protein
LALAEQKLIKRRPDPSDRRGPGVGLTVARKRRFPAFERDE